jgi:chemotaxis signal transduction protein
VGSADLAIVFALGSHLLALHAGMLREILEDAYVAPAPMAPASIEGVLNRLGRLHVVFDLGSLVGLPLHTRQKMLLFGHETYAFAAWVDAVCGVSKVAAEVDPGSKSLPFQTATAWFQGHAVPVLDAEALFRRVDELI